jgi:hypothetical protein
MREIKYIIHIIRTLSSPETYWHKLTR